MRRKVFPQAVAILFTVLGHSAFSHAASMPPLLSASGHWFMSFGVGNQYPSWLHVMKVHNNSGLPSPHNNDLYATQNQNHAVFSLALGRRWEREAYWFPYYSLSAFWEYLPPINLGNAIARFTEPEFTNHRYNWKLSSHLLLISAKTNLFKSGRFSPYINGGIGSSFNRTSHYFEKTRATTRVSPDFSSFYTSEFSYNLGAGLDIIFSPKLVLSVGYNYKDLGQISSGPGKNQWANQSLNPGSYRSNEVLVSGTYFFDQ